MPLAVTVIASALIATPRSEPVSKGLRAPSDAPRSAPASGASPSSAVLGKAVVRPVEPLPPAARPALTGTASWYGAKGLIAAAGPRLRVGRWRGSLVTVTSGGRSVVVRLSDWCQCYGTRLLDLSDDAFRRLAPLSRGLIRVTVTGTSLPNTDQ